MSELTNARREWERTRDHPILHNGEPDHPERGYIRCVTLYGADHPENFPQLRGRRGLGGRRADLENRYFRSAWEANYARYLNLLVSTGEIDHWEYEVDVFEFPVKRGSRSYLPDFKVWTTPDTFEYHEVKGYMDKRSATKLKRMAKHYPEVRLILIDAPVYRSLGRTVSALLPEWEYRGGVRSRGY